jgi:hypothetical protein
MKMIFGRGAALIHEVGGPTSRASKIKHRRMVGGVLI